MRLSELQAKDIISTYDGKKIGRIIDAEVLIDQGVINYFIVEPRKFVPNFINNGRETVINIKQIKKVGEDVILVDL